MQILPIVIALAVAGFQHLSPPSGARPVLVRAVLDGDTIDASDVGRVRLLGIDAPEIGRGLDTSAPFSREARDKLASLVLRRWVRLEQDGPALDVYDRHLAYVLTEDGVFVNAVLLREGLARISARLPLSRLSELEKAQAEAQALRRGMWGAAPVIHGPSYTRPLPPKRGPATKPRAGRKSRATKPRNPGSKTAHGRRTR